jgi:hypothetical protein
VAKTCRLSDLERLAMRAALTIFSVSMAFAGSAAVLDAQVPELAMLDRLEKGAWEVRPRDEGQARQRICLVGGRELIQLKHERLNCKRIVVEDLPQAVTVQYSCPGNGFGRTHIRKETDRLVQLDTQGIAGGLPYAFAAEARWVGPCNR